MVIGPGLTPNQAMTFGIATGEHLNLFGRNGAVTPPEDVWCGGGLYTGFPVSDSETLSVTSDDAADTAAGTGMQSIHVIGLGDDWSVQEETIATNGLTASTGTKKFRRVYKAHGATAGSGGTNAGNLTLTHSTTTANVMAYLVAGYGQCQLAVYTVPASHRSIVTRFRAAVSNNAGSTQEAIVAIATRDYGSGLWRIRRPIIVSTNASAEENMDGGFLLQEKTDIVLRLVSATASGLEVVGRFDVMTIPTEQQIAPW